MEQTMKAIADHGARFVGCNVMFLEGGTRDHFMRWLDAEHPELVDGYRTSMRESASPHTVRTFMPYSMRCGTIRTESPRRPRRPEDEPVKVAEQQMLRWKD